MAATRPVVCSASSEPRQSNLWPRQPNLQHQNQTNPMHWHGQLPLHCKRPFWPFGLFGPFLLWRLGESSATKKTRTYELCTCIVLHVWLSSIFRSSCEFARFSFSFANFTLKKTELYFSSSWEFARCSFSFANFTLLSSILQVLGSLQYFHFHSLTSLC